MKQCSKCKEYKDDSRFSKDKRNLNGLQSQCRDCQSVYNKSVQAARTAKKRAMRESDPELHKAYREIHRARYHANLEVNRVKSREAMRRRREQGKINKERKRAIDRAARERNRDRYREYQRQWAKKNAESVSGAKARYRENNREELRKKHRAYNTANKHILKAGKARRRARIRNAGPSFTAAEWRDLCIYYKHRCLCCGKSEPEIDLTADHVIPLVHGGKNTIDNIQPLCLTCNLRKGTKAHDYRTSRIEQLTFWSD